MMRSRDELPNPYASGLEPAGDRSAAVHYLLAGAVTAGVAGGLAMTGVAVADEGLDAEPSSGQVERAGAEEGPAGDAPPENEQWESVPPDREPDEPDDESSTPDLAGAPTPAPGTEDAEPVPAPAVEEPGAGFVAGVESALAVQRSTFESRIAAIRAATEAAERSRAHPDEDAVPPEAEEPPVEVPPQAEVPPAEVPPAEQPPVVEVPPAEVEPQADVPPVVEVPPVAEPSAEEPPPPAVEVPYVDVPPQVGAPLAEVPPVETEVPLESGGAGPEEAVQAPAEGPVSADPYRPGQPDSSPALHSVDDDGDHGGDDGDHGGDDGDHGGDDGDHGGDDGDHGGDDGDQDGDAPAPDVVEEIAGIEAAIAVDWTRTSGSILDFARSVARVAQERDNEPSTEEEQPEQPPVPEAEDPHGHDPHPGSAHGVGEDDLVPSPALTAERVSGPSPDGDALLAQAWGWVSRMIGDLWDDYDAILDPLEARLGIADADEDAVRVPPALTVVGGTGGGR